MDHILSELFTLTCPSWVALHGMAHSFIELQKPLCHDKAVIHKAGFSSSHVWMWQLDREEGWVPKKWCFQIVVLGKTLESPFNCKEIKPVNPKGNQPWIFIGSTIAEAESPILLTTWCEEPTHWKDLVAGKDWRQKEKGAAEGKMVRYYHWLDGHEFEQALAEEPGMLQSMGLQRVC